MEPSVLDRIVWGWRRKYWDAEAKRRTNLESDYTSAVPDYVFESYTVEEVAKFCPDVSLAEIWVEYVRWRLR